MSNLIEIKYARRIISGLLCSDSLTERAEKALLIAESLLIDKEKELIQDE